MKKFIVSMAVFFTAVLGFNAIAQVIVIGVPGGPCEGEYEHRRGASSVYCKDYFICEGNPRIWSRHTCPAGLEFNEFTETCDSPINFDHVCGCTEH